MRKTLLSIHGYWTTTSLLQCRQGFLSHTFKKGQSLPGCSSSQNGVQGTVWPGDWPPTSCILTVTSSWLAILFSLRKLNGTWIKRSKVWSQSFLSFQPLSRCRWLSGCSHMWVDLIFHTFQAENIRRCFLFKVHFEPLLFSSEVVFKKTTFLTCTDMHFIRYACSITYAHR